MVRMFMWLKNKDGSETLEGAVEFDKSKATRRDVKEWSSVLRGHARRLIDLNNHEGWVDRRIQFEEVA